SSTKNAVGGADIFRIKLYEDNPFIIVSGRVLHADTHEPMTGEPFSILVNDLQPDSLTINRDSATYSMTLPLNQLHVVAAALDNCTGTPERVEAQPEHIRLTKDLLLRPLPYVLVKGKVM